MTLEQVKRATRMQRELHINYAEAAKRVTEADTESVAPPEIRSSEWMDALAENYARTAEAIFDDPRLTREGKLTGVRMLFLEARRLPESASIG